jgi:hypothetical protein
MFRCLESVFKPWARRDPITRPVAPRLALALGAWQRLNRQLQRTVEQQ